MPAPSSTPKLYVFTISHYCEKARWALEYLAVNYELVTITPLVHRKIAKQFGLKRGSVPFLVAGNTVVQGSDAIIRWAEKKANNGRALQTEDEQVSATEKRLDDVLGVHTRRWYYSEAIIEHPKSVRAVFTDGVPLFQKLAIRLAWTKICPLMIKGMDLGAEQEIESRETIALELDWLDGLLARNGKFLCGDRLTSADLAAASFLAALALPPKYPASRLVTRPPRVSETVKLWQQRPVWQWVYETYTTWR